MPTIYHITTRDEWTAARTSGTYRAPSLDSQGFIHLSQRGQVLAVANAIYREQRDLVLLCVDAAALGEPLRYEPPDTTVPVPTEDLDPAQLFPHFYAPLPVAAVTAVVDFPPDDDGGFSLPSSLP